MTRQALLARIHPWSTGCSSRPCCFLERTIVPDPSRRRGPDRPCRAASAALSLLSVSDKTGLAEFGRGLHAVASSSVSTGGTAETLRQAGLPVTDVAAVTGVPEMLDGRVKTLHPRIHGGLLADRRQPEHRAHLAAEAIGPFDVLAVNLYPFAQGRGAGETDLDQLTEEIDIGDRAFSARRPRTLPRSPSLRGGSVPVRP